MVFSAYNISSRFLTG